ncbi:hypothetical protein niasHT_032586 [Heterodera trifolii]|uniref:Uncharacterized protein n=1 Tax=Heterodera trifolii TaxID=157864 RepID=A0ABD2ISD4_9BILA
MQLPRKAIGFKCIEIFYIDQNAIAFILRRFCQLFACRPINLIIYSTSDRILELIFCNIWPMIGKNICGMALFAGVFQHLRKLAPSILNDCPSLRFVSFNFDEFIPEFPADDSSAASDGQTVAKWLFTPRPDNVPKVLKCWLQLNDGNLASRIEAFKSAFVLASSPSNCIVSVWFPRSFVESVVPFNLTNELTREQLALKRINNSRRFLFVLFPIARDESKWTKWEEEVIDWEFIDQWNQIDIQITNERQIGDRLLKAMFSRSE